MLRGARLNLRARRWSLGVTLAELYSGRAFVVAATRGGLASEYAQLLGRPAALFSQGKLAAELFSLVAHMPETAPSRDVVRQKLAAYLEPTLAAGTSGAASVTPAVPPSVPSVNTSSDALLLLDLITRLLSYTPAERPSAQQALCHPFIAPVFPFGAVLGAVAAGSSGTGAAEAEPAADTAAVASNAQGDSKASVPFEPGAPKVITLRGTALTASPGAQGVKMIGPKHESSGGNGHGIKGVTHKRKWA